MKFSFFILMAITFSCDSIDRYSLSKGEWSVESSCPDAVKKSGIVDIKSRGIFSENGIAISDAKEFGLPENYFNIGDSLISIESETRECEAPLLSSQAKKLLFHCRSLDGNSEECQVFMEKI